MVNTTCINTLPLGRHGGDEGDETKTAKTTTTMVMAKAATRRGGLVSGGSGYLRAGVAEG